jgi:hypothetical protein
MALNHPLVLAAANAIVHGDPDDSAIIGNAIGRAVLYAISDAHLIAIRDGDDSTDFDPCPICDTVRW